MNGYMFQVFFNNHKLASHKITETFMWTPNSIQDMNAFETITEGKKRKKKALLLYSILTRDEMSLEAHYAVPDVERSLDHNIEY